GPRFLHREHVKKVYLNSAKSTRSLNPAYIYQTHIGLQQFGTWIILFKVVALHNLVVMHKATTELSERTQKGKH
ncbi:hypothetical protein PSY81_23345, partial [Shigella flexneri]|nr:hypothetical protein [Shigella flexneri]